MKVAILLPTAFDRSTLRKAKMLAVAARNARPLSGGPIEVAIGLPHDNETLWRRDEAELRAAAPGVVVRHLLWETVPLANARRMFADFKRPYVAEGLENVVVPRDWGTNFADCDFWFNLADPDLGGVYALRPTAHFAGQLPSRHTPYAFAASIGADYWRRQTDAFAMWRSGGIVVADFPSSGQEIVSYAGVHPDRVMTFPRLACPVTSAPDRPIESAPRSLIWRVEPGPAHDLANAARGLGVYLSEGGELEPVILSEAPAAAFGEASNIPEIVHLPPQYRDMVADLPFTRIVSDSRLARALAQGSLLWTSHLAGGDGLEVLEGTSFGLHVLAVDGAANRAAAACGGSVSFYKAGSADAVADALHQLEALVGTVAQRSSLADPEAQLALHTGFVLDRLAEFADD